MTTSGCKQITAADVVSGWNSSGPLADQIRRKKSLAASKATWAQKDNMRFGIDGDEWVRLRWSASNWAKRRTQGWSGRAVTQRLWRKVQDQAPQDKWSVGVPSWWTEHQP